MKENMAYLDFKMTREELFLSTVLCKEIVENIGGAYLKSDHFIGHKHIHALRLYLNTILFDEDKNSEDKILVSFDKITGLNLKTVLGLSEHVDRYFTEDQNNTIDNLFERFSDELSLSIRAEIDNNQNIING